MDEAAYAVYEAAHIACGTAYIERVMPSVTEEAAYAPYDTAHVAQDATHLAYDTADDPI